MHGSRFISGTISHRLADTRMLRKSVTRVGKFGTEGVREDEGLGQSKRDSEKS